MRVKAMLLLHTRPQFVGVALAFAAASGRVQGAEMRTPFEPPEGQIASKAKTGKERLSDKASDEQRADNCKVPSDRRGLKTRPNECNHNH
jgi:hypothetical protein